MDTGTLTVPPVCHFTGLMNGLTSGAALTENNEASTELTIIIIIIIIEFFIVA